MTARIATLSFETARREAPILVRDGRRSVDRWFEREVGPQDPERVSRLLKLVATELARHYEWVGERVRAAVIVTRDKGGRRGLFTPGTWNSTATTASQSGLQGSARALRLGVGSSLHSARGVRDHAPWRRPPGVRVAPGERRYIYSIPIFANVDEWRIADPEARSVPFAALVIDKETSIDELLLDPGEQDALANVAAIVGEEIRDRTIVRRPHAADPAGSSPNGPEPSGWTVIGGNGAVGVSQRKVRDAGDGDLGTRIARTLTRVNENRKQENSFPKPD